MSNHCIKHEALFFEDFFFRDLAVENIQTGGQ